MLRPLWGTGTALRSNALLEDLTFRDLRLYRYESGRSRFQWQIKQPVQLKDHSVLFDVTAPVCHLPAAGALSANRVSQIATTTSTPATAAPIVKGVSSDMSDVMTKSSASPTKWESGQ